MLNSETTVKNYQALLNDRKLCAAECSNCGMLMLPPRLVCPNCLSKKTTWKELSGRGKLRSFTVIHIPPTSHAEDAPYIVSVVELDEGPSITARLVGVNPQKPEELHVGDVVIADFEEITKKPDDQLIRLVFRPA